jgi:hypothetical protein
MGNLDNILLFKTNFVTETDKEVLCNLLKEAGVTNWHIDCEDCDRVLRIVSNTLQHQTIIKLINDHGYECCELT